MEYHLLLMEGGGPLFPPGHQLAYTLNNHTETVLIKTLLGH